MIPLALAALERRIAALEARLLREPRWLAVPGSGAVLLPQRLSRRGSRRALEVVEARVLAGLVALCRVEVA